MNILMIQYNQYMNGIKFVVLENEGQFYKISATTESVKFKSWTSTYDHKELEKSGVSVDDFLDAIEKFVVRLSPYESSNTGSQFLRNICNHIQNKNTDAWQFKNWVQLSRRFLFLIGNEKIETAIKNWS